MRWANFTDLMAEYRDITAKIEEEEKRRQPGAYEQLLRDNPVLAKKQAQFEDASRELIAVKQMHMKVKAECEIMCPPEKLNMIAELVQQNEELAYKAIKLQEFNQRQKNVYFDDSILKAIDRTSKEILDIKTKYRALAKQRFMDKSNSPVGLLIKADNLPADLRETINLRRQHQT